MALKLYMDEHVPRAITVGLRERSIDVITVQEDGNARRPDEALLSRSTELSRLMVTNDPDFLRLAQTWMDSGREHGGIVFWTQQTISIGSCISDLELISKAGLPEEFRSRVQFHPP